MEIYLHVGMAVAAVVVITLMVLIVCLISFVIGIYVGRSSVKGSVYIGADVYHHEVDDSDDGDDDDGDFENYVPQFPPDSWRGSPSPN